MKYANDKFCTYSLPFRYETAKQSTSVHQRWLSGTKRQCRTVSYTQCAFPVRNGKTEHFRTPEVAFWYERQCRTVSYTKCAFPVRNGKTEHFRTPEVAFRYERQCRTVSYTKCAFPVRNDNPEHFRTPEVAFWYERTCRVIFVQRSGLSGTRSKLQREEGRWDYGKMGLRKERT